MTWRSGFSQFSLVTILLTVCLLWSCNNPCKDISCNNGKCVDDGECACDPGYEGENCELTSNQKFIGTYLFTEVCDSSAAGAADTITVALKSGTTNELLFTGIYGSASQVEALVLSDGVSLEIDKQAIGNGKAIESVSGTISIDAANINLHYRVFDAVTDSLLDRCSGSMTRQ